MITKFSKRNRKVYIFKDMHEIARHVVETWKELSGKAIKDRGQFTSVLSGGKTPVIVYQNLSGEKDMSWEKTHIFMADERFVPYKSEENNYHMINRMLLRHVLIPAKNVHPVLTTESTPRASAARYAADLISFFGLKGAALPRFDLIVLGIGEDGHTASLFPEALSLQERKQLAIAVSPGEMKGPDRITITLPVINNARNIMFIVSGKNKAGIMHEILVKKNAALPAALVNPEDGKILFLLDDAAGSLLG
ncbi:MAG: 6-phosphogluconolactonase [Nitrospiraceae bacterium]|nr:MAG: 6-phosphogluconolactonase [Nitrospiraceae bacterium]